MKSDQITANHFLPAHVSMYLACAPWIGSKSASVQGFANMDFAPSVGAWQSMRKFYHLKYTVASIKVNSQIQPKPGSIQNFISKEKISHELDRTAFRS